MEYFVYWREKNINKYHKFNHSAMHYYIRHSYFHLSIYVFINSDIYFIHYLIYLFTIQGGFVSTQDTVVALQGLSLYGSQVNDYTTDVNVKVREAAKKSYFVSGRSTKRGGGAKRVCPLGKKNFLF